MICSPLLKEKLWSGKIQQANYPTLMLPYNNRQSVGFISPLKNSQARKGRSLSEDISKNYSKISERYWEGVKKRNQEYRQRQIDACYKESSQGSPGSPGSPGASIYIFRLAPEHYHRIHAPFDSEIVNIKTVEGSYRSVNPIVLNSQPVLQKNFRKIMELKNGMFFVAIGATCVGSIILSVKKGSKIVKGQDLGTFGFGGSCLVLVIPNELGKIKEKLKITTKERHIQPGALLGFID